MIQPLSIKLRSDGHGMQSVEIDSGPFTGHHVSMLSYIPHKGHWLVSATDCGPSFESALHRCMSDAYAYVAEQLRLEEEDRRARG